MKAIFTALLALILPMTLVAPNASAQQNLNLPESINESQDLLDYLSQLRAVQVAELAALETQVKWYQIVKASFQGSHAVATAFEDNSMAQTGVQGTKLGVQIVMDVYLAKMWLAGATPTAMIIKDIWAASMDNQARMTSVGRKTLESLRTLGRSLRVPKNVVSTAALGAFAFIQYENFWVINMSEAQYQTVIASLNTKIADLETRQALIADTYVPVSAR